MQLQHSHLLACRCAGRICWPFQTQFSRSHITIAGLDICQLTSKCRHLQVRQQHRQRVVRCRAGEPSAADVKKYVNTSTHYTVNLLCVLTQGVCQAIRHMLAAPWDMNVWTADMLLTLCTCNDLQGCSRNCHRSLCQQQHSCCLWQW